MEYIIKARGSCKQKITIFKNYLDKIQTQYPNNNNVLPVDTLNDQVEVRKHEVNFEHYQELQASVDLDHENDSDDR